MHTQQEIMDRYKLARSRLWPKQVSKPLSIPKDIEEMKPEEIPRQPEPYRLPEKVTAPFDWRLVLAEICLEYGVSPYRALSNERWEELILVRAELIHVLRDRGWSLSMIGKTIGRDHSSVLHMLRKYSRGSDALNELRSKRNRYMQKTMERDLGRQTKR